jgi:hypothetical protein
LRTIYFLDWLEKNGKISKEKFLENMKPENQGWKSRKKYYHSLDRFLKRFPSPEDWIDAAFLWSKSKYKPNIDDISPWSHIESLWIDFVNKNRDKYKIKFAREKIENFEILDKEIKILKQKKL